MAVNFKKNLLPFFILLNLFGFPIFVTINLYLGVNTSLGSIIYRALIVLLSFFIIINSLKKSYKLSLNTKLLFLFLFIYSLRLVYDLSFRQLYLKSPHYDSELTIYLFYFGGIILPVIAISLSKFETDKISRLLLYVSFFQCCMVLLGLYYLYGTNIQNVLLDRYLFQSEDINDGRGSPLNPILVSRCGAILFVTLLSDILFSKKNINIFFKFLAIGLSIALMLLGGSRGPIITCIIVSLIVLFVFFRKSKLTDFVKTISLASIALLVLFTGISNYSTDIGVFNRFEDTFKTDELDSGRSEHFTSAISQFVDNPFLGDQIFDKYLWLYPHNLILEAFMALGMLGGGLFLIILFKNAIKINSRSFELKKSINLILIFIIFLFFGMSSGSLYNSTEFWVSLATCNLILTNKYLVLKK